MLTQLGVVILGISFMHTPYYNANMTSNNLSIEVMEEITPLLVVSKSLIQPLPSSTTIALAFPPPTPGPAAGGDTEAPNDRAVNGRMVRSDTAGPGSGSARESGPSVKIGREVTQVHLSPPNCKIAQVRALDAAVGHRWVAARSARLARLHPTDCTHRADECGDPCQTNSSKPAAMTVARPNSG